MTSKYSEKQYNRAIERLDEIKELLRQPETDMFERYKLYSEELKLLEGVYDYELTNLEHKYEPLEARVQFLKDESYMDLFFSFLFAKYTKRIIEKKGAWNKWLLN